MRWTPAIALVVLGCPQEQALGRIEIGALERNSIAPGVELVHAPLRRGGAGAGALYAIYADPRSVDPELLINEGHAALKDIAPDALLVTNAGFFTPEWRPTGLLVSQGRQLAPLVPEGGAAGSGVLVVKGGRIHLFERGKVAPADFEGAALAIQAGPRIIENGEHPGIRSDDGKPGNRTVIGADRKGRLALAVVIGPGSALSGPTLYELQGLIGPKGLGRAPHAELGFRVALNLDGGPSTGLHLRHAAHTRNVPEASPVLSVLALRAKK